MKIGSFIYDPSLPNSPQLKLAGKRYCRDDSDCTLVRLDNGFSLLFAHASALHKETWEPTIQALFTLDQNRRIRDIWTLDWQHHGYSVTLNEDALRERPEGISISEWGFALARFMDAEYMQDRRVVAIGHSAGASAIMYSTRYLIPSQYSTSSPATPCTTSVSRFSSALGTLYTSIILVEPALIDRRTYDAHFDDREGQINAVMKSVVKSRATWNSREEALSWLTKKYPWKTWDRRVVKLFVEHGLRETRDVDGHTHVSVRCSKEHEARTYNDIDATFEAADMIEPTCVATPIHVIFGAREDVVPQYSQDSLIDQSQGRIMKSVTRLPGVGHMIPQENPESLAEAIYPIVDNTNQISAVGKTSTSKL